MQRSDGGTQSGAQIPRPTAVEDENDPFNLEVSAGLVRYHEWLMQRIAGSISGRTLEVGAGIGTLSAKVEPLCTELVLVEPAVSLCRHLEARFADVPKVRPCLGTLDQAVLDYPDEFDSGFDTIVSFNVLEHIEDDVGVLRMAATLLHPGGHVVLFVPSLPSLYGSIDAEVDHYRRYTKTTLSDAVRSAGLTLQRIEYFDFLGIVPWFISSRILRRTPSGSGIRTYDRLVVPMCRAFDRLVGPPLGKSLIAVAGPLDEIGHHDRASDVRRT
jgi:SAM-dependent methyltransferase